MSGFKPADRYSNLVPGCCDTAATFSLAKWSVFLGCFFGALFGEEFPQDGGALLLAYAGGDGAVVVEPLVLQEVHRATGGSALGVGRAKHHAVESAMNDRTGAHRARLLGGV